MLFESSAGTMLINCGESAQKATCPNVLPKKLTEKQKKRNTTPNPCTAVVGLLRGPRDDEEVLNPHVCTCFVAHAASSQ